jgi:energy-coupling factor transport system ATP-binding protein
VDSSPALNDITLTVNDGEFLGVIGHTGSGKSTFVQHVNGLLLPTRGRVVVNGIDLRDKGSRRAARRAVGMAFQYPEQQLFADSVLDDVAFGPRAVGVPEAEALRLAETALERVDVDVCTYGHRSPFELSGGEMRRVALAGILALQPSILVLDEPMAGLDPSGREQIMRIISRLHGAGMTIVFVSHDMEDIAAHADTVLVLLNGGIFAHGSPREVFSRGSELREIGLGIPRVARFAACLAELGLPLPHDVLTLDALADAIAVAAKSHPLEGVE